MVVCTLLCRSSLSSCWAFEHLSWSSLCVCYETAGSEANFPAATVRPTAAAHDGRQMQTEWKVFL